MKSAFTLTYKDRDQYTQTRTVSGLPSDALRTARRIWHTEQMKLNPEARISIRRGDKEFCVFQHDGVHGGSEMYWENDALFVKQRIPGKKQAAATDLPTPAQKLSVWGPVLDTPRTLKAS